MTDHEQAARFAFLSNCDVPRLLEELLAAIHADGGHHSYKVGLARSVLDAENKWYAMVQDATLWRAQQEHMKLMAKRLVHTAIGHELDNMARAVQLVREPMESDDKLRERILVLL